MTLNSATGTNQDAGSPFVSTQAILEKAAKLERASGNNVAILALEQPAPEAASAQPDLNDPAPAPQAQEPVATPTPEPQQVVDATLTSQPVKAEPAAIEAPVVDEDEVQRWKEEARGWHEKYSKLSKSAERLTPALQEAASAKKALEAKDSELSEIKAQLAEVMKHLQAGGATRQTPPPEAFDDLPVYDPSRDREFAEINPEYAERLQAVSAAQGTYFQRKLAEQQRIIDEMRNGLSMTQQETEQNKAREYQQKWDRQLTELIPDIGNILGGPEKVKALHTWAEKKFGGYTETLKRGYGSSPFDVAYIIREFKNENGLTSAPAKEPSLAEIVNPSMVGRQAPAIVEAEPEELLSDDQMRRSERIVSDLIMKGDMEGANAFMAKVALTNKRRK